MKEEVLTMCIKLCYKVIDDINNKYSLLDTLVSVSQEEREGKMEAKKSEKREVIEIITLLQDIRGDELREKLRGEM